MAESIFADQFSLTELHNYYFSGANAMHYGNITDSTALYVSVTVFIFFQSFEAGNSF